VSGQQQQEGGGCATFIVVVLVIGAVVAAVISIAALVDPFSWLPPVGEIWEDCEENYDTPGDDCELATRFPGFWPHVISNFAYVTAAVGLLACLAYAVVELREARAQRFSGPAAVERYGQARQTLALVGSLVGLVAALPIIVAVA
jgi:hypothetical protein